MFLHLVTLNANILAYGISPILDGADQQGLGTAPGGLAGRGAPGGQDLSLPEPARYRVF